LMVTSESVGRSMMFVADSWGPVLTELL
jgi:hypothetical protein